MKDVRTIRVVLAHFPGLENFADGESSAASIVVGSGSSQNNAKVTGVLTPKFPSATDIKGCRLIHCARVTKRYLDPGNHVVHFKVGNFDEGSIESRRKLHNNKIRRPKDAKTDAKEKGASTPFTVEGESLIEPRRNLFYDVLTDKSRIYALVEENTMVLKSGEVATFIAGGSRVGDLLDSDVGEYFGTTLVVQKNNIQIRKPPGFSYFVGLKILGPNRPLTAGCGLSTSAPSRMVDGLYCVSSRFGTSSGSKFLEPHEDCTLGELIEAKPSSSFSISPSEADQHSYLRWRNVRFLVGGEYHLCFCERFDINDGNSCLHWVEPSSSISVSGPTFDLTPKLDVSVLDDETGANSPIPKTVRTIPEHYMLLNSTSHNTLLHPGKMWTFAVEGKSLNRDNVLKVVNNRKALYPGLRGTGERSPIYSDGGSAATSSEAKSETNVIGYSIPHEALLNYASQGSNADGEISQPSSSAGNENGISTDSTIFLSAKSDVSAQQVVENLLGDGRRLSAEVAHVSKSDFERSISRTSGGGSHTNNLNSTKRPYSEADALMRLRKSLKSVHGNTIKTNCHGERTLVAQAQSGLSGAIQQRRATQVMRYKIHKRLLQNTFAGLPQWSESFSAGSISSEGSASSNLVGAGIDDHSSESKSSGTPVGTLDTGDLAVGDILAPAGGSNEFGPLSNFPENSGASAENGSTTPKPVAVSGISIPR